MICFSGWSGHLGAAILVAHVAAAEHRGELLGLGAVEALVPPAAGVHKPRAVRGAQDH